MIRTHLAQAWSALGGDAAELERVRFTGDPEGLLPSVWPALPVMAASIGCSTLAAALLHELPGEVTVDLEHVAVAAVSERHARLNDEQTPDPFAPMSRFFGTADGWMRLHANYTWHRERALQVLGVPEEHVADAIAERPGVELEEALAQGGALGFVVRTQDEWAAHPQGRAVAELPLVTHGSVDLPRRGGLRVLDLTRVIAGPVATRTLAAWGCDVLRLDSPHLPEIPAATVDTLPGKRSALLDLRVARDRLEELLAGADLVVQGYRPGALAAYGLGPDLAERHPHLSVVTLSAWGGVGPWGARRGFDSLVQCPTGIAAAAGVDGRPGALPAQVLDHATGYLAAAAGLLALTRPRSTQLSLAQTAAWLTSSTCDVEPAREVDPAPYLVRLGPVEVVGPPGRIAGLEPGWAGTTAYGSDEPVWL